MSSTTHAAHTAHGTRTNESKRRMLCRAGYAAHGVVYLLIGVLAIDAAFSAGQAQGAQGAISQLGTGIIGTILLTLLAIGLLGYSYLRLWQGLANPAGHGNDAKGIGMRIGRVASGLAQAGLAFYALSLAYGWFSSQGSGGAADLTQRVMQTPGGRWVIAAIGIGICLAAIAQIEKAFTASYMNDLRLSGEKRQWVKPLGRAAFSARFVVFMIVGIFVLVAAIQQQPNEARGLGGALRTLQEQPFGPWLLGAVGLGLLAFAAIRAVYARYAVLPNQQIHAAG